MFSAAAENCSPDTRCSRRLHVSLWSFSPGCMTGCEDVKGVKRSFLELHHDSEVNTHPWTLLISHPKLQAGTKEMGKASSEGRTSQRLNEGALAKVIDQFINYSIFTLINSKGSLYQWKGFPSPSLLGHQRKCACQVAAGQGRRARSCQNTKSLDCSGHAKASAEWAALEYLASP